VLCTCFAYVSQRDCFGFISMGLKIIFHWFGLMSFDMNIHKAGLNYGEKQQQLSRSEQRKGTPLRKRTIKDQLLSGALGSLNIWIGCNNTSI